MAKNRFPNGFESWQETHFEVVSHLLATLDIKDTLANNTMRHKGIGGMYEIAKELTDEFETKYKGIIWGDELDYSDTLEEFLKTK